MSRRRNLRRKIVILIVMILVILQFMQPEKNKSDRLGDDDISLVHDLPPGVHAMLQQKCYDCHSNNTRYPWYAHIQPIGWWLAAHVHDGKEELNFSEFRKYSEAAAEHKLEELREVAEDGVMPLKSYLILHPDAELTDEEVEKIKEWVTSLGI